MSSQKPASPTIQNVPLQERHLMQEKVAEDISKEAYDFMPVESFGSFLIKKMGYDEKQGIGRKQQIVRPIEFVPRNHRQGLGADPMPSILQKQKDGKEIPKELKNLVSKTGKSYNYIGDKLIDKNRQIDVNDKVNVIAGKHEGLQGFVTKVDKDKEEYLVELKNGQVVKVDKKQVKLVIPELEKIQEEIQNKGQNDSESEATSQSDDESDQSESSNDEKSSDNEKNKAKKSKKIKKDKDKKDKKSKKEKKSKKDKKKKKDSKKKRLKWVEPHIRIRIISKKYKDGQYYNVKAVISDIIDCYTFTVITPSKNTLEDLREKDIETIIPDIGKKVKVLTGENKGHIATLLERNKRKNEVVVQIVDTMETVVLSQDDVSEVVA
ncbi:hypothetical protein ABPG72_004078 [Tetrahymena utriculariae]